MTKQFNDHRKYLDKEGNLKAFNRGIVVFTILYAIGLISFVLFMVFHFIIN